MSDSGHSDLTTKQEAFIEALRRLETGTVREVADEMETSEFGTERVSDDEARGLAERTEAKGHVVQYEQDGEQKYRLA